MASHPFFQRFGLEPDADARAIRRVYARELKTIDQETDPGDFQQLRDSYESALAWAARQVKLPSLPPQDATLVVLDDTWLFAPSPGAVAEAPPPVSQTGTEPARRTEAGSPPPQTPEDTPSFAEEAVAQPGEPSPFELGWRVFDEFLLRMPTLCSLPVKGREAAWLDALRAMLADDRLLNFDARLAFEQRLAQLLAGGWRAGHEILFPTAAKALGWDQDRRTLTRMGVAGRALDLALDERAGYAAQDVSTRAAQRDVLSLLRAAKPPEEARILHEMPVLERMMARFPHWVPLVAPMEKVAFWRALYRERGGLGRTAPVSFNARLFAFLRALTGWGMVLLACWMIVHFWSGDSTVSAPRRGVDPAMLARRPPLPTVVPPVKEVAPTAARIQDIADRIRYKPDPHGKPGIQRARFEVFLDENGRIIGVNRKEPAADPAFTAAVESAILASAPFPPDTRKIFIVSYAVELKRATRLREAPPDWAERRAAEPDHKGLRFQFVPKTAPGPAQPPAQ